jgi:hypothetical protein
MEIPAAVEEPMGTGFGFLFTQHQANFVISNNFQTPCLQPIYLLFACWRRKALTSVKDELKVKAGELTGLGSSSGNVLRVG